MKDSIEMDTVGIPLTGWRCIICGLNANVMSSSTTWCWNHYKQSYDYLGPEKGKTWMQLREDYEIQKRS